MRTAWLALADGTVYQGRAFGASGDVFGEVVFNTSMSGYEEILTDPSYAGQLVALTYPEIGNSGFTDTDAQSSRAWAKGLIVRNACLEPSNFRSRSGINEWFSERGLVGITGIDTRAITRKIRRGGTLMGVLSTAEDVEPEALVERAKSLSLTDAGELVAEASTKESYAWTEGSPQVIPGQREPAAPTGKRVVVVDFGVKKAILRQLVDMGTAVHVVPWNTTAEQVLALQPDGVVLSTGPGDPASVAGAAELVAGLVGQVPLMGIGLGHQLLALGVGGKTYKLKAGHRGSNHPVMEKATGRIQITAQNHGFAVDADSLADKATVTHSSLFDGCCEGLEVPGKRAFGVQFHPESAPGPSDTRDTFLRFSQMMGAHEKSAAQR